MVSGTLHIGAVDRIVLDGGHHLTEYITGTISLTSLARNNVVLPASTGDVPIYTHDNIQSVLRNLGVE